MADSTTETNREHGFVKLKEHVLANKIDLALWVTRVLSILFTLGYLFPLFWNRYNLFYKVLLCNASTSSLRLYQRLPQVQLTKEFLQRLLMEDSCHYLLYSIIFLYTAPVAMILQPIFLFSLVHVSSYSLTLMDCIGQNSWWFARILINLIGFQSKNLLKLISLTEILLMPFSVILLFLGYANLFTPFFYYHFLCLRYSSRRNPYTRNLFHELRVVMEGFASKPTTPGFLKQAMMTTISLSSRLAPAVHVEQ